MIAAPTPTPVAVRALLLAAVLFTSPTAFAGSGAEPRFPIETIVVAGTRYVSPELLISESRLAEGETYTEAELLEAVYRIQRLPFVLGAEMALERGSERGLLRLVITVEEIRRYFFGGGILFSRFDREIALGRIFPADTSTRYEPVAGVRFAAGDYGLFFFAVNGGSLQAGYSRYRLFGRQAFLSLGVARSGCCPIDVPPLGLDPTFSSWSSDRGATTASLTLGIPLPAKNQSLRLSARYREIEEGSRRTVFAADPPADLFFHDDADDAGLELAWIFDTRDDPVLPTRGDGFTAAVELRRLDTPLDERRSFDETSGLFIARGAPEGSMRSRLLRATFTAERHRPLARRQALSAKLRLAAGRSELDDLAVDSRVVPKADLDVFEGALSLRHAVNLWQPRGRGRVQELWWENTVDLGYEETSFAGTGPLRRFSFTTALTFRNRWGIFRLGFAFVDVGRIT